MSVYNRLVNLEEELNMPQRLAHLFADTRYLHLPVGRGCIAVITTWAAQAMDFPILQSMVGWLILWWAALATGEIVSCYLCTHRALRKGFPWERKFTGKLLLVFIVLVAMSLDWMLHKLGSALPGEWQGALGVIPLPITTASLVWLNIAEGARIIVNIGETEGRDSIPPVVRWVLLKMKQVDEARFPGTGTPQERWSDPEKLTDAQIRELLLQGGIIDADGKLATPPRKPRKEKKDA